jgi:hypothetical protein
LNRSDVARAAQGKRGGALDRRRCRLHDFHLSLNSRLMNQVSSR